MRASAALLTLLFVPAVTFAQSGETVADTAPEEQVGIPPGIATITIEQEAVSGAMGSWLLSLPDHSQRTGTSASETLSGMPSGNYVVYAKLPNGASSTIRVYKNGVLDKLLERQQTPIAVYPGDDIRVSIQFRLTKTGTISVQSDPDGTAFTLTGPENAVYTGITPITYQTMPEGQYKVQYESFGEGCVKPAPKAGLLAPEARVSFTIRIECDAATKAREHAQKEAKKYLVIVADGVDVQLQDVLQKDWFATYVYEAAKRGILAGYRDADGKLTGMFGPGNSVTVAELAKIAHRLAGLSEGAFADVAPKNGSGANQWFSPFLASAESRAWIIYADGTIDPLRPATRAEVVVTLLQAFDVPLKWQKGSVFRDVPVSHRYAAAIETAAGDSVIGGRTGESGKSLGIFDPEASITRAEISKIITTMLSTYKSPTTLRNAAAREQD